MEYFDSHAHYDDEKFDANREKILQEILYILHLIIILKKTK